MDLAGVPWSEIGQTWLTELMNEETFTCGEEKLPEHQQTRAEAPRDRPPNVAGWEAAENATRLAWSVTRRRTNKSAPKSNGHRARWRRGQGRELGRGREGPAAPPRATGSAANRREPREPPTHGSDVKRRCRLSAQGRRAPTAQTGARPGAGGRASPRDANRADDKRGCVARTTNDPTGACGRGPGDPVRADGRTWRASGVRRQAPTRNLLRETVPQEEK